MHQRIQLHMYTKSRTHRKEEKYRDAGMWVSCLVYRMNYLFVWLFCTWTTFDVTTYRKEYVFLVLVHSSNIGNWVSVFNNAHTFTLNKERKNSLATEIPGNINHSTPSVHIFNRKISFPKKSITYKWGIHLLFANIPSSNNIPFFASSINMSICM